ncbi:MAG: helix-turn-helix domain-containing protein [Planctomycetota bacterium]
MPDHSIDASMRTVARLLEVSQTTIYRMVRAGVLPSFRFGRAIRVPLDAVEKLRRERLAEGYRPYRKRAAGRKLGP